MGNKKKSEKESPADHLRIMAFARSLVPTPPDLHIEKNPKASEILEVLAMLSPEIEISEVTARNWVAGKKLPTKELERIKQEFPRCVDWLVPALDSSPMRRFLCALDIWGSRIDSSARTLDTTSKGITVGSGLAAIAKQWGSVPSPTDKCDFSLECHIPRLGARVPQQVPLVVYQPSNLLTLMEFMFRCGPYLKLSDGEFADWAVDLASLTLLIAAFIEGRTFAERVQSGSVCDYNTLPFNIFFRGHGNWPNSKSVSDALEEFSELKDSAANYADRLIQARDVLRKELLSIGCDLSITDKLSLRIVGRDRMWQKSLIG